MASKTPKMTKVHFELIAEMVKTLGYSSNPDLCRDDCITVKEIAGRVADMCAKTNPKFDRERFLRACEVKED